MSARIISLVVGGLCLAASGLLPCTALAQNDIPKPIGKVQNVTGKATIEHTRDVVVQAKLAAGDPGQAKPDDSIYLGDVVQTTAGSTIAIIFGDGTSFNVSENARMTINEFIYDPKGTSNSTLFSLTKGTFTFLAGKTAKSGNMRVETPVGTMGIRGTAPHVEILDDGTVKFLTLIEEDKNRATNQPPQTPRERRAQNPSPAPAKPSKDVVKVQDICRGC